MGASTACCVWRVGGDRRLLSAERALVIQHPSTYYSLLTRFCVQSVLAIQRIEAAVTDEERGAAEAAAAVLYTSWKLQPNALPRPR